MTPQHPTGEDLTALYEQYATHIRPVITRTGDNRWCAKYPGFRWHVTADSDEAAADDISAEALRRFDAGEPEPQPARPADPPPPAPRPRRLRHGPRAVPVRARQRRPHRHPTSIRVSRTAPRRRPLVHQERPHSRKRPPRPVIGHRVALQP